MKKVILFGSTGNLGKAIAREVVRQGYDLTAVVRNESKAASLSGVTQKYIIADVRKKESLHNILQGNEIVISALGKSVSPNDRSAPTYRDVDFAANVRILDDAKKAGVKKFVYISAFHAEKYLHLEYFKVHHDFAELLMKSGIDYSIIKPPSLFSAYLDMIEMAKNGTLVTIGKGDKKTNPIFEGDLAKVTVESIRQANSTIEAGGKSVYTRRQLSEIVQGFVDKKKKIRTVPLGLMTAALPVIRMVNKNIYDKFAFFTTVMQHDTIAPEIGEMTFEEYVKQKANEMKK